MRLIQFLFVVSFALGACSNNPTDSPFDVSADMGLNDASDLSFDNFQIETVMLNPATFTLAELGMADEYLEVVVILSGENSVQPEDVTVLNIQNIAASPQSTSKNGNQISLSQIPKTGSTNPSSVTT